MDSAREMFVHQLNDLKDAETRLAAALNKMQRAVSSQALSSALQQHRKESEEHAARIDQIFLDLDARPRRHPCIGMAGLIDEFNAFAKEEKPGRELLDVYAIGASIKIEHYEISAYESLIAMAQKLALNEAANILEQNLQEEREYLRKLHELGQELIAQLPEEEDAVLEEPVAASPKRQRGR